MTAKEEDDRRQCRLSSFTRKEYLCCPFSLRRKKLTCQEFAPLVTSPLLNVTKLALPSFAGRKLSSMTEPLQLPDFPLTMGFVKVPSISVTKRYKRPHECPCPKVL